MTQTATLSHAHSTARTHGEGPARVAVSADPGPWLLFIMPVTFTITVLVISWLSKTSF